MTIDVFPPAKPQLTELSVPEDAALLAAFVIQRAMPEHERPIDKDPKPFTDVLHCFRSSLIRHAFEILEKVEWCMSAVQQGR